MLVLELDRAEVAESGVASEDVVEALEPLKDRRQAGSSEWPWPPTQSI